MSDQEGTPSKVPRFGTPDSEPSTPSRQADDVAPASPLQLADHRSPILSPSRLPDIKITPPTPLRHADYKSSSSTSVGQTHSDSLSTSSRHPLEDTGNETAPDFLVMEQDVDMEDADNLSPSKSSGSPNSSFQSAAKFFEELGSGLISFSKRLQACVKQSETESEPEPESESESESESEPEPEPEPKTKTKTKTKTGTGTGTGTEKKEREWVRGYKRTPLRRQEAMSEDSYDDQPPHQTHMLGVHILDIFCFEVSTEKLQDKRIPEQIKQKLGSCVIPEKNSICSVPACSPCGLDECQACPHIYQCDCTSKEEYNGGNWCAHIHVAYAKNMAVYGTAACLIILEDYRNLTEKRHIRAMIQGSDKMARSETKLYLEKFDYLVRSERYYVIVNEIPRRKCKCEAAKICAHCKACWCRYSCTCEDYWLERQVCEHIHNVVMQRRKKEFSFNNFEESEIAVRDKPSAFDMIRERIMMFEHETGCQKQFKNVEVVSEGQKWKLVIVQDGKVEIAYVSVQEKWKSNCICQKKKNAKANKCVLCKICKFHYSCDCQLSVRKLVPICRHMHAVERSRRIKPTEENLFQREKMKYYYEARTELEEKLKSLNIRTREPEGVVQRGPENPTPTSSSATSQQEN